MWAEAGRCAKGAAPKGKSEEREGGALRQKRRAKGPAPEGKSEERGGRRPFCMLRDVDFPRVHGFPGFGSLPSPRAGGRKFSCFLNPVPRSGIGSAVG